MVDPRRTETAQVASAHHAIRPGGDVWLLLAMLQVIHAEQLTRKERVQAWTHGLDTVAALVAVESISSGGRIFEGMLQ